MRRRGFTLVELLVVMAITGGLTAVVLAHVREVRDHTRHDGRILQWTGAAQVAFGRLGQDLRAARRVEVGDDQIRCSGEGPPVAWQRAEVGAGAALVRVSDGQTTVMAPDVERFVVQRDGRRLHVILEFERREGVWRARAREATILALWPGQ